jgi:hypothetical protein
MVAIAGGGLIAAVGAPHAAPSASPLSATAATVLAKLTVQDERRTGYRRSEFHIWVDSDRDGCDTRQEVLSGEAIVKPALGADCKSIGGEWRSVYDGIVTNDPSSFDVDHLVPLAEAWDSGASAWDAGTRQAFANDLGAKNSLVAVSASSNRQKGDRDPTDWLPRPADHCRYVVAWIATKARWSLSIDTAEKTALVQLLHACPSRRITYRLATP